MFFKKKWFHFFSGFFCLVVSIYCGYYLWEGGSLLISLKLGWSTQSVDLVFLLDKISFLFVFMVSVVSLVVLKYAYWYMSESYFHNKFFIVFWLFVISMVVMSLSGNLLGVMLGWDGLGVTSFFLVMFFSNWKSFNSAMITFLSNRMGDFFFIMSIWWFLSFGDLTTPGLVGWMLFFTMITKSAQIPFSAWLPAAMMAPTPVSSLVHSSTLVTAGVFLMIRFIVFFSEEKLLAVLILSSLTMIVAGFSALAEMDFKKIVALSTLSHLGMMFFFLSFKLVDSTLIHLLTHSFFKSLLFMVVGVCIHSNLGFQNSFGVVSSSTLVGLLTFLTTLSNMGAPFLSGFYSKELLVLAMFSSDQKFSVLESVVFFVSLNLTCLYSLRVAYILTSEHFFTLPSFWSFSFSKELLRWMLFSFFLACSAGGVVVWFVVDLSVIMEFSFFLKSVKFLIFFFMVLVLGLFFSGKKTKGFGWFFGNMWFIYFFSKVFSKLYFKVSFVNLWVVDLKGFLSKTPQFLGFGLKKSYLILSPSELMVVSLSSVLLVNLFLC